MAVRRLMIFAGVTALIGGVTAISWLAKSVPGPKSDIDFDWCVIRHNGTGVGTRRESAPWIDVIWQQGANSDLLPRGGASEGASEVDVELMRFDNGERKIVGRLGWWENVNSNALVLEEYGRTWIGFVDMQLIWLARTKRKAIFDDPLVIESSLDVPDADIQCLNLGVLRRLLTDAEFERVVRLNANGLDQKAVSYARDLVGRDRK